MCWCPSMAMQLAAANSPGGLVRCCCRCSIPACARGYLNHPGMAGCPAAACASALSMGHCCAAPRRHVWEAAVLLRGGAHAELWFTDRRRSCRRPYILMYQACPCHVPSLMPVAPANVQCHIILFSVSQGHSSQEISQNRWVHWSAIRLAQ